MGIETTAFSAYLGSCAGLRIDPGDEVGQRRSAIVMPGERWKLHAARRAKTGNAEAKKDVFQPRGQSSCGQSSGDADGRDAARDGSKGDWQTGFGCLTKINDAVKR